MASRTELTEALSRVVAGTLRPFSLGFGLFILYQGIEGSLEEVGPNRNAIVAADLVVAAYLLGLAAFLQWRPPPLAWMNPLGASLAAGLAATDLITTWGRGVVPAFPATALVLAGVGAVLLNWRWMVGISAAVWAAWLAVTFNWTSNPTDSLFTMQIAGITGLSLHWGRMRAYRQLIEARDSEAAAKEELQKLNEELDRFAGVAAHDLKSPISAIRLKANLLKRRSDEPELHQTVAELDHVAQNIGRMVDDLLAYARAGREDVAPRPARLDMVAKGIFEQFAERFEVVQGRLVVHPMPHFMADETSLQQLLQNLVSNALIHRSERPPWVTVGGRVEAGVLTLTITDNGRGFEPSKARQIFEPFQRDNPQVAGHGLGLATCKRIVEGLGGTIRADSKLGEGSTFIVEIPEKGKEEEKSEAD